MNPNCNGGSTGVGTPPTPTPRCQSGAGDRRFVAYAATPTAAGPSGGTLTLLPGVPGSSTPAGTGGTIPGFCNSQDGGTKIDIYTFIVATTGHGPDRDRQHQVRRRSRHRSERTTPAPPRAQHSTTTGPVRQFIFFTNVTTATTTLFKLNTANNALGAGDSNAWITTIGMTGPPKSFAVTTGTNLVEDDQRRHDHRVRHRCLRCSGHGEQHVLHRHRVGQRDVRRLAEPERDRHRSRDRPAAEHRRCRDSTGPGGPEHPGVDHHLQQPGERAVGAHAEQPAC